MGKVRSGLQANGHMAWALPADGHALEGTAVAGSIEGDRRDIKEETRADLQAQHALHDKPNGGEPP